MSLTKTVALNLKANRVLRGLTQQALADRAKVSVSYISMLEREERSPPLDTLEVLAKALKVSPTALLS
jgi:transcriptional regulator with XRE-family HTH domain